MGRVGGASLSRGKTLKNNSHTMTRAQSPGGGGEKPLSGFPLSGGNLSGLGTRLGKLIHLFCSVVSCPSSLCWESGMKERKRRSRLTE